tara:strand:- start:607 stop:1137 length:531 start_codon:yes stop_codon:yes gene_type:complete
MPDGSLMADSEMPGHSAQLGGNYKLDTARLNPRILDKASSFPPKSGYRVTIEPNQGEIIQASQCVATGMTVAYEGDPNSFTKSPSMFQYNGLSSSAFYKVVFQDSTNLPNNPNFVADTSNMVYMWVYFGLTETRHTSNLNTKQVFVNVVINKTVTTKIEVTNPINIIEKEITNFNF